MNLNALADFCLVCSEGGLGKASRITGRSKSSLSRHVAKLELELDVRLVERGVHGLALTEAGKRLIAKSENLISELFEVLSDIKDGSTEPQGILRVASPGLFSQVLLGGLCAKFMQRYPEVRLEVTAADRFADLVEERIDVAIRVNPAPETNLVGRCFARDQMVLVAAPSVSQPARSEDIAAVHAIGLADREADRWSLDNGNVVLRPLYVARFSSLLMVRDAALAGAGAAALPKSLARHDLATGRLIDWGSLDKGEIELWVLHTSRRFTSPKVRAFVEFIHEYYAGKELLIG